MQDNQSAFTSKEYDRKIKQTLPFYEEFYRQVVDVVRNDRSGAVSWLDVGCGTGKMAEVARHHIPIKRFVGCDCSQAMVEVVRKRLPYASMEFTVADSRKLRYKEEFDVVTAIQVNHYLHTEDRKTAIRNCYQALRKGGLFFTFENYAPDSEYGKELTLKRWKNYQMEQGKSEAESTAHIGRYNKEYFPITIREHRKVLEECGFLTVELLWLSYLQAGFVAVK